MNRSLANVLFGAFGAAAAAAERKSADGPDGRKAIIAEDAAMQLAYAQQVIVVPGYGHGGRAGAAPGARAGGPDREARRRGASTPSTRSPAACPGT